MRKYLQNIVYYLARGRSLEVILAYEGRLRAYFEDYAETIPKGRDWLPHTHLVIDHSKVVGWAGIPLGDGLRNLRYSRLGFLVPNAKSKLGKELLNDLTALNSRHDRLSGEVLTSELTGETLVLSKGPAGLESVSYGYEKIGDDFVISAPEGCPAPIDAEPMARSEYWARKEAIEQKDREANRF